VTLFDPSGSATDKLATPLPFRVTVAPSVFTPFMNVTVPVGTPVVFEVTVAVNVTV